MKHLVACLPLLLSAGLAPAVTLVQSSFDTGAEDWGARNGISSRDWVASGGQSGGYIQATDDGDGTVWFFVAPAAYLGDQSAALGGTLSFWLKTSTLALPMANNWADIRIGGGGLELAIDAGAAPGLDWRFYSVALSAGAWRLGTVDGALASSAEIATVLANVDHLWIRGEYSAWWDTGGLDSVVLSAVPEPHAGWLAALGLVALGLKRRTGA